MKPRSMQELIAEIKRHVIPHAKLTADEKRSYVVDQLCNFAEEMNSAYYEQIGGLVNYRLSSDDIAALWSIAEWAAYDFAVDLWRRDEENDAAWQFHERGDQSDSVKARIAKAPAIPKSLRLKPPEDCPVLPTAERPRRWDTLVEEFIKRRRSHR
jgi:hypothetical protein